MAREGQGILDSQYDLMMMMMMIEVLWYLIRKDKNTPIIKKTFFLMFFLVKIHFNDIKKPSFSPITSQKKRLIFKKAKASFIRSSQDNDPQHLSVGVCYLTCYLDHLDDWWSLMTSAILVNCCFHFGEPETGENF